MNENLSLAISDDGKSITVKQCRDFLSRKDKVELANFIHSRLYGRYLKPFDFPSEHYKKNYKNGFALMTSSCLLIETLISFKEAKYRNTNQLSGECFGYFFITEQKFVDLAIGGRQLDGSISTKKQGGMPNDFYENVRCAILHNAETKNGWTITRDPSKPYFNTTTKEINATKFANRLKSVLKNYKKSLIIADFDNDLIWKNFKNRLEDLINNS